MDIIICLLGIILNTAIFMGIRKNKHRENFLQMLSLGMIVSGTIYGIVNQVITWFFGAHSIVTGLVVIVVGCALGIVWLTCFGKLQKYNFGLEEIIGCVFMVLFVVGIIIYRGECNNADDLMRLMQCVAAGMLFYSMMRDKMKQRSSLVVGIIMSLFILLGHPFANALYGNAILGVAMNWILVDFLLVRMYRNDHFRNSTITVFMLLEALFFAVCYPAGLFILLVMMIPLFWLRFYNTSLLMNVIAMVVTLVVAGINIWLNFGSIGKYDVFYFEQQRALFINSWSDVGFFVFFILLYIYTRIEKKKDFEQLYWPVAGLVAYLVVIFSAKWFGFHTYDDFNTLYLVWMIFMYVGVTGLLETFEEFKLFLVSYVITIMFVFCLMLSGIEETLQEINIWYCVEVKANEYLQVYDWNWKALKDNRKAKEPLQELMEKCKELRAGNEDMVIPAIITDREYRLEDYYRKTGQEEYFRYMYMQQRPLLNATQQQLNVWEDAILTRYDIPYVLVERDCKLYWFGIGIYGYMDVVYENDYGMIMKFDVEKVHQFE